MTLTLRLLVYEGHMADVWVTYGWCTAVYPAYVRPFIFSFIFRLFFHSFFDIYHGFYSSAEGHPFKTQGLFAGTLFNVSHIILIICQQYVKRRLAYVATCLLGNGRISAIYPLHIKRTSAVSPPCLITSLAILFYKSYFYLVLVNLRVLRALLSWVYAISSGQLCWMMGKPWLRVIWRGSLLKDPESCKGILQ